MKRKSSHLDSPQNQNNASSESEGTETVDTKRRKAEYNPLKMGVIVEKILSFLDAKSINAARQLNELWSIEGAKMLFTKCFIKIPWSPWDKSPTKDKVNRFKAFLSFKSNEVSMIPNITVRDARDLEQWKSLGVAGNQVKSVKLNSLDNKAELLSNILDLLPNIQYLSFRDINKVLFCSNQIDIFKVLLSTMNKPEKDGKPLVIFFISLNPDKIEELEEIEKFAACKNIMIEELEVSLWSEFLNNIPHVEARIANFLNKLLSNSQNTLQKLSLGYKIYLSLLDFPKMTKLTLLNLSHGTSDQSAYCKFSPTFQFSEKIPNLREFKIVYLRVANDLREQDFFVNLFENTEATPSVKKLTISDNVFGLNIEPVLKTFPNIEEFQSFGVNSSRIMFDALWKHGKNLKKLDLKFFCCENVVDLDSFFTGFTPEIVEWIKNAPEGGKSALNAEVLKVHPSIVDLKGLDEIKLVFDSGFSETVLPKLCLAVAGEFAFMSMEKNPKIFIHVSESGRRMECARKSFSEVSKLPNITVEFFNFDERDRDIGNIEYSDISDDDFIGSDDDDFSA